jgi:dual 3',5'-cyclic-AMP and -GMP phosphodiesterase 11
VEKDDGTKISPQLASYVIQTGEKLNLADAYADERFDPSVDSVWSFKTRSVLCLPIRNQRGQIIGCAQVTNRLDDEPFDENDEQLFEAFCIFCGLGINNTIIFNRLETSMAEKSVALEVLSYHATYTKSELHAFLNKYSNDGGGVSSYYQRDQDVQYSAAVSELMRREYLGSYLFDDFALNKDEMVLAAYEIFKQSGLMNTFQIEKNVIAQFCIYFFNYATAN